MMSMDNPINMETVFGYGEQREVVDSLIGAGKRLLSGESLFFTGSLPSCLMRAIEIVFLQNRERHFPSKLLSLLG